MVILEGLIRQCSYKQLGKTCSNIFTRRHSSSSDLTVKWKPREAVIPHFDFIALSDETSFLQNLELRRINSTEFEQKLLGLGNAKLLDEYKQLHLELVKIDAIRKDGELEQAVGVQLRNESDRLKNLISNKFGYIKEVMYKVPNSLHSIYFQDEFRFDLKEDPALNRPISQETMTKSLGFQTSNLGQLEAERNSLAVQRPYPSSYWNAVSKTKRLYHCLLPNSRLSINPALIRKSFATDLFNELMDESRTVCEQFKLIGSGSLASLLIPYIRCNIQSNCLPLHLVGLSRLYYPQRQRISVLSLGCEVSPFEHIPTDLRCDGKHVLTDPQFSGWFLVPPHRLAMHESFRIVNSPSVHDLLSARNENSVDGYENDKAESCGLVQFSGMGNYISRLLAIRHNKDIAVHRHEKFPSISFFQITV